MQSARVDVNDVVELRNRTAGAEYGQISVPGIADRSFVRQFDNNYFPLAANGDYADPNEVPVFESKAQYAEAAGLFVNDISQLGGSPDTSSSAANRIYTDPNELPIFESNAQYADAAGLFVNSVNDIVPNPVTIDFHCADKTHIWKKKIGIGAKVTESNVCE